MNAELNSLARAFDSLTAGKSLEGRARQLTFNIAQQLANARRRVSRGKPLEAVPRKLLVQDIDELATLLRGDAGVSP